MNLHKSVHRIDRLYPAKIWHYELQYIGFVGSWFEAAAFFNQSKFARDLFENF